MTSKNLFRFQDKHQNNHRNQSPLIGAFSLYLNDHTTYILKGERNLYTSKVSTSIPETEGRMGDPNAYKEHRLDKIVSRYYYHAVLCRLRYDDCLVQLSLEFDYTSRVLILKLNQRNALLDRLIESNTTALTLKKRYPYFDWSAKPLVNRSRPQRRSQR